MPEIGPGRYSARAPETTGVPRARSEDIARRKRMYVIQMSIRMVCVISLPFLPGTGWKIAALVGAVVLPYVAVLMANDQREAPEAAAMFDHDDAPAELTATASGPPAGAHHRVLRVDEDGSVHDEDDDGDEDEDDQIVEVDQDGQSDAGTTADGDGDDSPAGGLRDGTGRFP